MKTLLTISAALLAAIGGFRDRAFGGGLASILRMGQRGVSRF